MKCPLIQDECEETECVFWCTETDDCKLVQNCQRNHEINTKLDVVIEQLGVLIEK
jgi:hypothetical protein